MMNIGRVCLKLMGRDSNKKCVIIQELDDHMVLIDGETRRRKCNVAHLEPLNQTLDIEENASHDSVIKAFKELGIEIPERKPKQASPRPRSARMQHTKEQTAAADVKKAGKKETADKKEAVKK